MDIEQLCRSNRDYVKLWIAPFYRLTRRNPPMWYSRLLLEALIEVYQSWYQQMKRLNEPFYLKIWLYNPNFINSQIVVAFRDCLDYYDNTFDKSNDKNHTPHICMEKYLVSRNLVGSSPYIHVTIDSKMNGRLTSKLGTVALMMLIWGRTIRKHRTVRPPFCK